MGDKMSPVPTPHLTNYHEGYPAFEYILIMGLVLVVIGLITWLYIKIENKKRKLNKQRRNEMDNKHVVQNRLISTKQARELGSISRKDEREIHENDSKAFEELVKSIVSNRRLASRIVHAWCKDNGYWLLPKNH